MREHTRISGLHVPFLFLVKIDTREDAINHKVISYKYHSNSICTVVEEWHHSYFCHFRTLAFLFPLVASTFASFNATHSLTMLDHCSCERVVYRHGAILLILRVRNGFSTRRFRPHGGR